MTLSANLRVVERRYSGIFGTYKGPNGYDLTTEVQMARDAAIMVDNMAGLIRDRGPEAMVGQLGLGKARLAMEAAWTDVCGGHRGGPISADKLGIAAGNMLAAWAGATGRPRIRDFYVQAGKAWTPSLSQ